LEIEKITSITELLIKTDGDKPDILFLEFHSRIKHWRKYCCEIKEKYPGIKIIAIVTYEVYFQYKDVINEFTRGYISKDAWSKVYIAAMIAVRQGYFFRRDRIDHNVPKMGAKIQSDKSDKIAASDPKADEQIADDPIVASDLKAITGDPIEINDGREIPEWLDSLCHTITSETIKNLKKPNDYKEMVKNLTMIIEAMENARNKAIRILLTNKNDTLDKNSTERFDLETLLIDNLLLKEYSNWDIADMLNKYLEKDYQNNLKKDLDKDNLKKDLEKGCLNNLNKTRFHRLELILRISGKNTMTFHNTWHGNSVHLTDREAQLLRLIAAGYNNEKIGHYLSRDINAIKGLRKSLIEKFKVINDNVNSMRIVIRALRMGLIRLEEIEDLIPDDIISSVHKPENLK